MLVDLILYFMKRILICIFQSVRQMFCTKAKVWLYLISRTGKSTCPYAMLRLYLKAANIADSDECYICRSLTYCSRSKTYKLRSECPYLTFVQEKFGCFRKIGLR